MTAPLPTSEAQVHFDTSGIKWLPYMYSPYMAALIAFMVLEWLAVIGRIYVRTFLVKAFGKDDIACIVTLILTTAFNGCILTIWRLTNLQALADIYPGNWLVAIQLTLATLTLYIVATTALKIALGLLLLRVLVKRWMQIVIYTIMAVTFVYGMIYFFIVLFECGPPVDFPSKIILGQCLPRATTDGLSYTHAVLTAIADLIYAILPIIFLWDAAFSRRAKISVGAILVLGSFGCVCTFIRIGWIHYLTGATVTYYVTTKGIVLMSVIELSIGLVCISLATYRPLVNRYIRRRDPSYYYANGARRTTGAGADTFSSRHVASTDMAAPPKAWVPLPQRWDAGPGSPLTPMEKHKSWAGRSVESGAESEYWHRP